MMRPVHAPLALVALALGAGCGQTLTVDHWRAPEADIGGARVLAVTDAYGRDASVAAITDLAVETADQSAWFLDVTTAARLETDGREVWLRDGALRPGVLYVRLDVLEDNAVVVTTEDEGGVHESISAHTLLAVTVADARGLILDELELEGVHERSGGALWDIDAALEASARAAVQSALAMVTPQPAHTNIPLDDRDAKVNEVVKRHLDERAVDAAEAAAQLAQLDGAPALWNRAVLLESAGEGDLALYDAAVAHEDAADWYDDQRTAARQRHDAARELGL